MADDSGLEVDALGGAPGVYSARYAGEPCSYSNNNEKLLRELAGKSDRSARFRTVVALSDPAGNAETQEGACPGVIIEELRGTNGFGYDPLFVPDGYSETFAELDPEVKNRISHRARALHKAEKVKDIPVLLLSAVNQQSNMSFGFSETDISEDFMPVQGFIEKPVEPNILLAKVDELLGTT